MAQVGSEFHLNEVLCGKICAIHNSRNKVSIKDPTPRRFDSHAVDSSGLDDFLASALPAPTAAAALESLSTGVPPTNLLQFAVIEPEDVGEVILIIPANDDGQGYVVDPEVMTGLRGEIQAWLALLRQQGQMVTELLPLSVRDQSSRKIVSRFLEVAYSAPSRSWMTTLATGRQLVIAPAHVVNTVGFEGICRVAHKAAILTAQAAGEPFNARALSQYLAAAPAEMH